MKNLLKFLLLQSLFFLYPFSSNAEVAVQETAKDHEMNSLQKATFAGGCFWCIQPSFDALKNKGVIKTEVGYTGGKVENPSYKEVCSGTTGHFEALQVTYDPNQISYEELLNIYWHNIDPTDPEGQFCDRGAQYHTAIFYHNEEQKKLAESSKKNLVNNPKISTVYTEILSAQTFFPAEDYHQKYYQKSHSKYKCYRSSSGRDERLKELWGNPV